MKKLNVIVFSLLVIVFTIAPAFSEAADNAYFLSKEGRITVVDTETNTISSYFEIGRTTYDIAINSALDQAYVTNQRYSRLMVIDLNEESVITYRSVGNDMTPTTVSVSPSGDFAYVGAYKKFAGYIYVYDTYQKYFSKKIQISTNYSHVIDVKINPVGDFAYATTENNIVVIDTASHSVITSIPAGGVTEFIFSPQGDRAYATVFTGNNPGILLEIDTTTHSITRSRTIGEWPSGWPGIAISPAGDYLYISTSHSHNVDIIDTASLSTIESVYISDYFGEKIVAISPSGDFAYVVPNNESVRVLDTNTYSIVSTFGAGPVRSIAFLIRNNTPTANAGADVTAECAGPEGATVTLDGSASTDPDGDVLSYTWTGTFGTATGETATVTLPLGTHTVTLTVDDGNGGTATDEVVITVADTTPPVITIFGIADGEIYALGLVPEAGYDVMDTCSGVASSSALLVGGEDVCSDSFTYNVTATDNAGNEGTETATYEVIATAEGLLAVIHQMVLDGLVAPQMENSLVSQVQNGAFKAFINHVGAQSGKKIDPAAAAMLINAGGCF